MFPVLETESLILREITKDDTDAIFACFSNEEVTRFYGLERMERVEQAEEMIDFFIKSYNEKRGVRWGMERKGTKGIIGTVGFNSWLPNHRRAEIGYEIHPEHWRKGYTAEAVSKVLSYGFIEMELTRIGAIVFLGNEASNKLLMKLGFQKEGILRNYMYQNGKAYDTNVYALLK